MLFPFPHFPFLVSRFQIPLLVLPLMMTGAKTSRSTWEVLRSTWVCSRRREIKPLTSRRESSQVDERVLTTTGAKTSRVDVRGSQVYVSVLTSTGDKTSHVHVRILWGLRKSAHDDGSFVVKPLTSTWELVPYARDVLRTPRAHKRREAAALKGSWGKGRGEPVSN